MDDQVDPAPSTPIRPGRDWVAFSGRPLGFLGSVVARLAEFDGRVRIVELRLGGNGEPLNPAALRRLPISAMERVAATALSLDGVEADGQSIEVLWPDDGLDVFSAEIRNSWPESDPPPGQLIALYGRADGRLTYMGMREPSVKWHRGQEITDDFLRSVGDAYDLAIQRGESPAKSISESTGASRKTVQSWIYQGRRRGVIAPAPGKGRIA